MIDWVERGNMPKEMRDGRRILLASPNLQGTAEGGDGVRLDPRWPFSIYVARCVEDIWITTESDGYGAEAFTLAHHEFSHFAEIDSPANR